MYSAMSERGKLRKKIDTFEPEISGSLWDRIEHDLNRKDKKSAWFIYSMLLGLLGIALAGGLYYYMQYQAVNQKLSSLQDVDTASQYMLLDKAKEKVESEKNNSKNGLIPKAESNNARIAEQQKRFNAKQSFAQVLNQKTEHTQETQSETKTAFIPEPIIQKHADAFITFATRKETFAFGLSDELLFNALPANLEINEPEKIKTKSFLELALYTSYGLNQSIIAGALAENFAYENALLVHHGSIQMRYNFKGNYVLGLGLSQFASGTAIGYKIEEVIVTDTLPALQSIKRIVPGDSARLTNKQQWIEIPFMLSYRKPISTRLGLEGGLGLGVAFKLSYQGVEPNPAFSAFETAGTFGHKPFRTHLNASAFLSVNYMLSPAWMLSLGGLYRGSLSSISNRYEPVHPKRNNTFIGANLGLIYRLGY